MQQIQSHQQQPQQTASGWTPQWQQALPSISLVPAASGATADTSARGWGWGWGRGRGRFSEGRMDRWKLLVPCFKRPLIPESYDSASGYASASMKASCWINPSLNRDILEADAHDIMTDLDKIRIAIAKENATVEELMSSVNKLMESTQATVHSYMMLKQPMTSSIAPFYDFYSGLPKRPSSFMQATVTRFEKYLIECDNWVEELEQFLLTNTDKSSSFRSSLKSLPNVCNANFELLIHVAAKVPLVFHPNQQLL